MTYSILISIQRETVFAGFDTDGITPLGGEYYVR